MDLPTHCDSLDVYIRKEFELNSKLDNGWLEKARAELNETDNEREIKLAQLAERIEFDGDLANTRLDDAFLLRFLRARKFDVDKSFNMVQKYYKMKREVSDLFRVSPLSKLHGMLNRQMSQVLPDRDDNGCAVFIFRVRNCDPYECEAASVFRSNVLSFENAIRDPKTQISGIVVLLDMTDVRIAHTKFLSRYLAKRTVEVVQEAFPMRFKAFHIYNEPFYFDAVLTVLKPFMKAKIRSRIVTHGGDLQSLHRHIPKSILPAEYGGLQGSFDNTKWREQIINDEEYFNRLEMYTNSHENANH